LFFTSGHKNKKFRVVTIRASALKKLQAHCKAPEPHSEPFGDTCQGDYIFCNPDGSPLKPDTVSISVSLLFRNLKLPKGASLHTPRDTHSSHLLSAGVPLTEVSKRLGQVKPHVTSTAYAHALPAGTALPQRHGRVPECRATVEAPSGKAGKARTGKEISLRASLFISL
jgi:integrase